MRFILQTRDSYARLFSFQRACILDLFDGTGSYVPTWDGIGVTAKDRLAYSHVSALLKSHGLSDGESPPVWSYECKPDDLDLLATMLLSDHELANLEYVTLELLVPEQKFLRTSYGEWCELYFSILDSGRIVDDGRWLEKIVKDGDDDTVQAIMPRLHKNWIVSCERLQITVDV